MIPANINSLLLSAADTVAPTGYQISRSLRFNSADSAYLSRTPTSAGNRKTWTWAGWVKRSALGSRQNVFGTGDASFYNGFWLEFFSNDRIRIGDIGASTLDLEIITTQVFRDPSSWGHLVVAVDTTQSTNSNRIKIYWNGSQITAFSTATYPTQNFDTRFNTTAAHGIGRAGSYNGQYFSGYLADIYFIDGQALDPTSFGEFDATTGVWNPKAYTGSYGTNGFRLTFSDNSAATATTLGKDAAGSNNWTPTNLSVTAGAGNDSLVDVPTNGAQTDTGVGGEVRGNYCVMNPLTRTSQLTFTNGNLDVEIDTGSFVWSTVAGTIAMSSGKWYFEATCVNRAGADDIAVGIVRSDQNLSGYFLPGDLGQIAYAYFDNATTRFSTINSGQPVSYGASYTNGDIIGVAFDATNNTLTYYKNGVSQGTAFTSINSSAGWLPFVSGGNTNDNRWTLNFGQRPFAYTAPSGFKALNTANLPAPLVTKPSTVMDVKLYTGNGSTQTISGLGFSPDLVWIKNRTSTGYHSLFDAIRGTGKTLFSNDTSAEVTNDPGGYLTSFDSTGFGVTVGSANGLSVNNSSQAFAAWTWDAGSSTVTNTSGSISSQVRANATAGFSVVTYTGTGANATVGHGLGVAPGMVIVKRRDTTSNWQVRHTSIAAASSIQLNLTNAAASATTVWNSTAPTSTVFSIGTDATVNASGGTYVAYCFAPVAGYSSFGSYTGNGSADGPFVFCNFRPAVVIVKMSSSTGNWTILDSKREGYNVDNDPLYPNLNNAEGTTDLIDITSNGFKVRTTDATFNTNAGTYVYAAWAESPFQYSRAR
jgi:hypothetical protein